MRVEDFGNGPVPSPEIEAAIDYGLREERLTVWVHPTQRPQILVSDKWERIVDTAERWLRRQGMIRP